MFKIRKGAFETNSSSTHSMIICTDEELKYYSGTGGVYVFNDTVYLKNELIEHLKNKRTGCDDVLDYLQYEGVLVVENKGIDEFTSADWDLVFSLCGEYDFPIKTFQDYTDYAASCSREINGEKIHAFCVEISSN